MRFEIKNRWDGTLLFSIETESWKLAVEGAIKAKINLSYADLHYADLRYANLHYADLRYANLHYADLRYANLSYADLRYADLSYADLSSADLHYADLRYANLHYAKNINKYLCTPLLILHDQVGKIRAYKLVTSEGIGPFNGGIKYEIGASYEVSDANTNEFEQCGKGINVATLDWCMKEWREGYRILIAEFTAKDIAVIPTATDGKFRVFRCKIVGEKDLKEIGILKEERK